MAEAQKELPRFTAEQKVELLTIQKKMLQLNIQATQIEKAQKDTSAQLNQRAGKMIQDMGVDLTEVSLDIDSLELKYKDTSRNQQKSSIMEQLGRAV